MGAASSTLSLSSLSASLTSPSPSERRIAATALSAHFRSLPPSTANPPLGASPAETRLLTRRLAAAAARPTERAAGTDAVLAALDALGALCDTLSAAEAELASAAAVERLAELAAPLRRRALPALVARCLGRDLRVAAAATAVLRSVCALQVVRHAAWMPVASAALLYRDAANEENLRRLLRGLTDLVHIIVYQSVCAEGGGGGERRGRRRGVQGGDGRRQETGGGRGVEEREGGRTKKTHLQSLVQKARRPRRDSVLDREPRRTSSLASASLGSLPRVLRRDRDSSAANDPNTANVAGRGGVANASNAANGSGAAPVRRYMSRDMHVAMSCLVALLRNTRSPPAAQSLAAAELVTILVNARSGRRPRAAGVSEELYKEIALSAFVESSPKLYAAVSGTLFAEEDGRGISAVSRPLQNRRCDLTTAGSCLSLLNAMLSSERASCTPRAPLLSGLATRAELLAAHAGMLCREPPSAAVTREQADCLEATVATLRTFVLAAPPSCEDVQIELVAADCLHSICLVGAHASRSVLRDALALASDNTVLQCMVAWVAIATVSPRGLLWERGPSYCETIAYLALLARHIARVCLLRDSMDDVPTFLTQPESVVVALGSNRLGETGVDIVVERNVVSGEMGAAGDVKQDIVDVGAASSPPRRAAVLKNMIPAAESYRLANKVASDGLDALSIGAVDLDVEIDDVEEDSEDGVAPVEGSRSASRYNIEMEDDSEGNTMGVARSREFVHDSERTDSPRNATASAPTPAVPRLAKYIACGMEIEEEDRLREAFANCIHTLIAQCEATTVAHDLLRTLMYIYATDPRRGGVGGDERLRVSLSRDGDDDSTAWRLGVLSEAKPGDIGAWFGDTEVQTEDEPFVAEFSYALLVALDASSSGLEGASVKRRAMEDVAAAQAPVLSAAFGKAGEALGFPIPSPAAASSASGDAIRGMSSQQRASAEGELDNLKSELASLKKAFEASVRRAEALDASVAASARPDRASSPWLRWSKRSSSSTAAPADRTHDSLAERDSCGSKLPCLQVGARSLSG